MACFNPRARTGRDLRLRVSASVRTCRFNPRARTGRDQSIPQLDTSAVMFQSTRPHGARPATGQAGCPRDRVSIHAPARGATSTVTSTVTSTAFQSTRPHGARPGRHHRQDRRAGVSIHAPARGATLSTGRPAASAPCFNPRARTGRDGCYRGVDILPRLFQSTRPHGARHEGWHDQAMVQRFQSTRPHGARHTCLSTAAAMRGFNPRARTGRDARCP